MTAVRQATAADLPRVCESLRKAFSDDPVMSHVLPPTIRNREKRLAGLMGMEARSAIADGTVWSADGGAANAIWRAPGKWKLGGMETLRQTPAVLRVLRGKALHGLAVLNAVEAKHPTEPHWYLATLGTEPEAQGRGLGSSVIAPVLDRCDAEGLPAYLESSKEANIPFYERHGFRVTEELPLPRSGPSVWLMWRDPQPS